VRASLSVALELSSISMSSASRIGMPARMNAASCREKVIRSLPLTFLAKNLFVAEGAVGAATGTSRSTCG
jgi:hypothetical protein